MIYLTVEHSRAIASDLWLIPLFCLSAFVYYLFDLWLAKTCFKSIDLANLVVPNLDRYPEQMYYLINKNNYREESLISSDRGYNQKGLQSF